MFLEQAELGEPFFRIPPEDIVRQVVFEPQRVRERAWVVYFNYMLLSAVSAKHYGGDEADKLRRNTQLALNDSSIFLEPREANIQALTLLAMHGEDYAAPNLSWMLLGHACRQAEALGLHAPAHQDLEARQQKLCLFWLLFMVDKSCSLAFGRPAFLPTSLYCNVPLPEDRFLLRFHPHDKAALGNRQALLPATTFGAVFFSRSIELSKLTGSILDVLATGGSSLAKRDIRSKLDAWYKNANQVRRYYVCNAEDWALLTVWTDPSGNHERRERFGQCRRGPGDGSRGQQLQVSLPTCPHRPPKRGRI